MKDKIKPTDWLRKEVMDQLPFAYNKEIGAYQLTIPHRRHLTTYYDCVDFEIFVIHKNERITISHEITTYEKLDQYLMLLYGVGIEGF